MSGARNSAAPGDGFLFQERLLEEPFWMLVACSLVNRTTWDVARRAFESIRAAWPTPSELASADPAELEGPLRPLGLWRQRARRLPLLAQAWLASPPSTAADVGRLPGCGRYAADSWAIFVEGRPDVDPTDGKLNWYLDQLNTSRRLTMTIPSTISGLLSAYNEEAARIGAPALKYWKSSKDKLQHKYDALRREAPPAQAKSAPVLLAKAEVDFVDRPSGKIVELEVKAAERPLMKVETDEDIDAEIRAMPPIADATCIKDVACQLLTAVRCIDPVDNRVVGYSYAAVLRRIAQLFPESTTSNACLRWYLVRIRQELEGFDRHRMPIKFKRPKSVKGA